MIKKLLIFLVLGVLLFVLSGCKSAKEDSHGNPLETIKAIVSHGDGTSETVDVKQYSTGQATVRLYLADGREIFTSYVNVVLITSPIK